MPATFEAREARTRGCSPLVTPKKLSRCKNASRFAKTGCGAQRPLRALSGTRVLLTAAPTAPPCFRHWRRSSLLHIFLTSPFYGFADGFTFLLDVASSKGVKSAAKQQIGEVQKNAFSEAASIFPLRLPLRGLKGASSPFLVDPCPCRAKHAAFASQTGLSA